MDRFASLSKPVFPLTWEYIQGLYIAYSKVATTTYPSEKMGTAGPAAYRIELWRGEYSLADSDPETRMGTLGAPTLEGAMALCVEREEELKCELV